MLHGASPRDDSFGWMKKIEFSLTLLLMIFARPAMKGAEAKAFVAQRACALPALSLSALLAAHDARSRTKDLQARALAQVKRARASAWLPALTLSADHRRRQDQRLDQELVAPLSQQRRHEQGVVLRASMRWQLDRLVHHHASLSALRLAENLSRQHAQARSALAQRFTRWQFLYLKGCKGAAFSEQEHLDCELLRAQILVATGVVLPQVRP